jgi:hypothetical protein
VAVVEACEPAALAGAVVFAEVGCEPAALVAVPCVQLASTGAERLQVIGLRELTSAGLEGRTGVCPADLATGRAGVGAVVAGAEAGAGTEAGADGVGAQPR